MSTWKILVTDGLDSSGIAILKKSAEVVELTGITPEDLLIEIVDFDALIVRGRTKVTPAILAAGKNLKVVGRAGVGVDNIDLIAAGVHGVTVVNSPMATTTAVAELTMGLMLAAVREIPRADSSIKAGKWLKKEFEGYELSNKTLGVIGFGRIGAAVARRATAFDMTILGYDPKVPADEIINRGGKSVSMDELLAQSDIITMHLPLTDLTRGLINADVFGKMKTGTYLICAARGGVIDEPALLEALNSGKLAGAALDVFVTEPPGLTDLVAHPKLICTPHIGAQTVEAQRRASNDIAEEVLAALNGLPLRWKVA